MITDETNPEEFGKKPQQDHVDIKGWGNDADPRNDPTYPMKKRTDEEQRGYQWDRPAQQPQTIEVLRSVERPNLSATFGTAAPPRGCSGSIRRFAFKFSESSYGRWLPLVLADRVDQMEGIMEDLRRGHIPNIIAERGWTAEWKYNRKLLLIKLVVGTLVTTALMVVLSSAKKRQR